MAKIQIPLIATFTKILLGGALVVALSGCAVKPLPSAQHLLDTAPRLELPKGESLLAFTRRALVPYFEQLERAEVPVPDDINVALLEILSPSYRNQRTFWLGTNKEYPPIRPVKDPFAEIRGKSILLNRSAVALKGESLGVRDSNQSRALSTLIQYPLFQLQKVLRIVSSWNAEEFLVVPINRNNLRVFIGKYGEDFSDPSYINYCGQLQRMQRSEFFSAWASTLVNGFDPVVVANLSTEERQVLFETAGIYIAESFKRIRLVRNKDGAEHISGENLSSLVLLSPFLGQKGTPFATANCSFFQKNYRKRIELRKNFEREISAYLKLHHPKLIQRKQSTKVEGVFDPLYRGLEASMYVRERELRRYDQVLRVLISERRQIAKFLITRKTILKKNSSKSKGEIAQE